MNPTDPFPRHTTFEDRDIPNYYYGIRLKEKLQITFSICRFLWITIFFRLQPKANFNLSLILFGLHWAHLAASIKTPDPCTVFYRIDEIHSSIWRQYWTKLAVSSHFLRHFYEETRCSLQISGIWKPLDKISGVTDRTLYHSSLLKTFVYLTCSFLCNFALLRIMGIKRISWAFDDSTSVFIGSQ